MSLDFSFFRFLHGVANIIVLTDKNQIVFGLSKSARIAIRRMFTMAAAHRDDPNEKGGRGKTGVPIVCVCSAAMIGLLVGGLLLQYQLLQELQLFPRRLPAKVLERFGSKLRIWNHENSVRNQLDNYNGDNKDENDWTPNVIFGNYSMPITFYPKNSDDADNSFQSAFDVALMECYGFAFFEARKIATKLLLEMENSQPHSDAKYYCPMCHWLLAMGHSPYINHPIVADPSDFRAAAESAAMAFAQALHPPKDAAETRLSTKEFGLIDALHLRFSPPSYFQNQTIGYDLYEKRLRELHEQLLLETDGRGDADVMAFLADSIMVLHADANGYEFYDQETKEPKPAIAYAISLLEACFNNSPDHPLCQHLYIHITEPSHTMVELSGPVADHLLANTDASNNDAQHLQHMPSHSYLRIGRYHDAVRSNVVAHASDQRYEDHGAVAYAVAHDLVVLITAARLSGELSVGLDYANVLRENYQRHPNRGDGPGTEVGWHVWRTLLLDFGDYAAVLDDGDGIPGGGAKHNDNGLARGRTAKTVSWPYAVVLGHYAKGVASLWNESANSSRDYRLLNAKNHQKKLRETIRLVDPSYRGMVSVADWTLEAAIQYYEIVSPIDNTATDEFGGDGDGNVHDRFGPILTVLRSARAEQESWPYTEPPDWHANLRLCEGTILRIMRRYEEAAEAFEADLVDLPENRFGLYGLLRVLEDKGASEDKIREMRDRFERSSSWADQSVRERPPLVCPELGE